MTSFSEAITPWFDSDDLIGDGPSPQPWSSGNSLLETSIAGIIETLRYGSMANLVLIRRIEKGIRGCRVPPFTFDKNPKRPDDITRDDLIGIAAVSRLCGMSYAKDLYEVGERTGWNLSNSENDYYSAHALPWDVAFYKMAAGQKPAAYETVCLMMHFLAATFEKAPSGDRLRWIMGSAIRGSNPWVDLAFDIWRWQAWHHYGDVSGLMKEYYQKRPDHPFIEYSRGLLYCPR